MDDKILKFIGLSKRAGKLICGEVNTCSSIRCGKAVLTMVASDASMNARKRLENLSAQKWFHMIELPYTKEELAQSIGTGLCSMCAVTDRNFASEILKLVSEKNSD